MRRSTAWAAPALLTSVICTGQVLAQKSATAAPAEKKTTIADLFSFPGFGNKKPEVTPQSAKAEEEMKKAARIAQSDALKKWEMSEYMRRIAVCDKLRRVAELTNDVQLERMVDDFEVRIGNLFRRGDSQK